MSLFLKCVISLRTMVWNYGYECFNTPETKDREYLYVAFDGQLSHKIYSIQSNRCFTFVKVEDNIFNVCLQFESSRFDYSIEITFLNDGK